MSKRITRFQPGSSGNPATQWRPGQSGNPVGKSKLRADFERAFTDALVSTGTAEEAAELLWKAARNGEAWAIQNLCQRFAPETRSLRIIQEQENEEIDYSKLSDDQLQQLDAILRKANRSEEAIDSGESSPPAA